MVWMGAGETDDHHIFIKGEGAELEPNRDRLTSTDRRHGHPRLVAFSSSSLSDVRHKKRDSREVLGIRTETRTAGTRNNSK